MRIVLNPMGPIVRRHPDLYSNDYFNIFAVLNSFLPAYILIFFSFSLVFKNVILKRISLFYNLRVTIICSVSGSFIILKIFINYKKLINLVKYNP